MNLRKRLKSDGSDVCDSLRGIAEDEGLAQLVRDLRLVPGFENTTVQKVVNWIQGEDKDRAYQAYLIVIGLSKVDLQLNRIQKNRDVLRRLDRLLRDMIEDTPYDPMKAAYMILRMDLQSLRAELNHALRMKKKRLTTQSG